MPEERSNTQKNQDYSEPQSHGYMRPVEAAEYTGLSESMLAKMRMREKRPAGPRFIKVSGCILYRRAELDEWLDSHAVDGEV